jgi:hypothetical protein
MMAKMKVQAKKKAEIKKVDNTPRIDSTIREAGKFELKKNESFTINFGLVDFEGRWLLAKENEGEGIESCWVKFKMWSFEEEVSLKSQATQWDSQKRMHTLNNDFFNRLKIQKLLVDWSFSKDNATFKLHRVQNTLTDESFGAFLKLHRNICSHIIENMNRVLEYNG